MRTARSSSGCPTAHLQAAAAGADQAQLTHQPFDGAAGYRDALAVERKPHLSRPIGPEVVLVHPQNVGPQLLVAAFSCAGLTVGNDAGPGVVVTGWGDRAAVLRQHGADRLDSRPQSAITPVGVAGDEPHECVEGRSSSAAKKADAAGSYRDRDACFQEEATGSLENETGVRPRCSTLLIGPTCSSSMIVT